MTRPRPMRSADTYGARRRGAAALAVVIALAGGVALIATSGSVRPRARATSATTPGPASVPFPHTPAGAVAAATTWCQSTGVAFFNGTWDSAVSALASPTFAARAQRDAGRASAVIHHHLRATHTRYLVRTWPLGYAIEQYAPTSARVRVWQLAVFDISTPNEVLAYPITTVSLEWVEGNWKITDAPPGPDLTPPGHAAGAGQVTSWMTSVDLLTDYSYAP